MKRALDAIPADAAVPEVRAKVRAERLHREYGVRVLAPPNDQCTAQALQVAHLPAPKRLRTEQPVPAVGIGRGIAGETQLIGESGLSASRTASQEGHANDSTSLRRM